MQQHDLVPRFYEEAHRLVLSHIGFALLDLLPYAGLGWLRSPCFQQKSHGCCWVTTACSMHVNFLCMLLQPATEQRHGTALPEIFLLASRFPVVSQR